MAKSYSVDLRERVVRAIDSGASARSVARVFSISASSAIKWGQRWRSTGQVEASSARGHRRSPLEDHADWLLALIAGRADLTLEEIHERIRERDVSTSVSSLRRGRPGGKINPRLIPTRSSSSTKPARTPPGRMLRIRLEMTRLRGRCKCGERLIGRAPHGHRKTTTFVAGLRNNAIAAPCVTDRPTNGEILGAFSPNECANYFRHAGYA